MNRIHLRGLRGLCRRGAVVFAAPVAVVFASIGPVGAARAQTAPTDSVQIDSVRAQRLGVVRVEVARSATALDRIAWAVGAQTAEDIQRGQATLGIDEALANIPGVVVSNRYNYAVDQRLSIRGSGSRANFGLRGVKVLLDGIPQSLPDGQSQLTNVDLAAISRIEVLRGSASSLYGNGSGGVISFLTDLRAPDRLGISTRFTGGSFGTAKSQARVSGRHGATVGAVSVSRTTVDGFRDHSAADMRQLMAAVDHALSDRVTLELRGGTAETPMSLNPGALTLVEYEVDRDRAALNNVRRGASKELSQRYVSLRARGETGTGAWSAAVYGQRRLLTNAIAAPPPDASEPANGTLITLDRRVTGLRLDAARELTFGGAWRPRLSAGLDLQRAFDVRRNDRTTGARPTMPDDTLLVLQDETQTTVGPFAQLQVDPHPDVTVSVGGRWDRLGFRVEDRFQADGADDSAERAMVASTGHVGVVWRASEALVPYANVSTAFESPTSTELAARADGQGGFNPELGPQRTRTVEIGARGRLGGPGERGALGRFLSGVRAGYQVALFDASATDAIVQYELVGGRAYYRNAGRTASRGVELGLTALATDWLELRAAWTYADYTFAEYRVPSATQPAPTLDTLDGNQMAGVPRNALRLGARATWGDFSLDADHSVQGALWGDDRNTARVDGWGAGQLNIRATWSGEVGGWRMEPFVSVQNALNTAYVGAVTLNGFGGRVLEPAPLRNWYAGVEMAVPIIR